MNSFPSLLESIDDLSKIQIEELLTLSTHFLHNKPTPGPPNYLQPVIATSFLENSTRTKHSFAIAIQRLGSIYIDFNAETSSLKKGESLEETFLTLYNQGVDLCIFRSSVSNQLAKFKKSPPIKIINGGDGTNEHPTQALLDLFTLLEFSKELHGKTIAIFGDIIHSRVTHSLLKLLPHFGLKIILCGPKYFMPEFSTISKDIKVTQNRDEAIMASDFLYLLRIQQERHSENQFQNTHSNDYHHDYGIKLSHLKHLNKLIPIFHPGPANIGIELDHELIKSSLYQGYNQVKNSVPVRMAIIKSMLSNNDKNIGIINGEKF